MLFNALILALREIRRKPGRAFLTMLGVVIGVAAVITMVTLGDGATNSVRAEISKLGNNLIVLRPGGNTARWGSGGAPYFTQDDIALIKEQIPGVVKAVPMIESSLPTVYRQNSRTSGIRGSTPDYFTVYKWSLTSGRMFDEEDYAKGASVCVIGSTVVKELFNDENPVGASLRIGNFSAEVIGVLATKGQSGMGDQDDTIIIPLTSMQRRFVGRSSMRDIRQISISAADDANPDRLMADLTALMRQRRNLNRTKDDNFYMYDTRQFVESISKSTRTMTTLLAAVAAVSLLVGGIGIMNIMLVSVTERTREIGIRLAIGARAHEVLLQFLVEATTLSACGGIIGILLAAAASYAMAGMIKVPFIFQPGLNLIAFFFSVGVGMIFGFMPARRAARLDPIAALRHE